MIKIGILSKEKDLYGSEVQVVTQREKYAIYRMVSANGQGTMTSYNVFPGIEILYNDFHMGTCFDNKRSLNNIMEINHCRQGRFECDFPNGSCVYLEEGDLSVNMLGNRIKNSYFPLEHYQGVSIVIDIDEAANSISTVLSDISIDLYALRDKLCSGNRCFIMRAKDSVDHIFSELYTVPDKVKFGYFKIKVLELLLFLSIVEVSELKDERTYFSKKQVEIVKSLKAYITENLEYHYTLKELSDHFGISLTSLKLCFKGVYGTSIYAFMRSYRMQTAAVLLRQGTESVTTIANKVGYINASKFASAFKKIMGVSPLAYRKMERPNGVKIDCLE